MRTVVGIGGASQADVVYVAQLATIPWWLTKKNRLILIASMGRFGRNGMITVLLASSVGLAWDLPGGTGPAATGRVAFVETWANGSVHFTLEGTPTICGTGANAQGWGLIDTGASGLTTDGQKGMLSLLMASKLAGKPVTVDANLVPGSGCLVGVIVSLP